MQQRYADAYKSILPPEELRNRVLAAAQTPVVQKKNTSIAVFRRVAAVAACFAVFAAAVFALTPVPKLSTDGSVLQAVSANVGVPMAARRNVQMPVGLSLQTDHKTELTLQGATVSVYDSHAQLLFEAVDACTVEEDCMLVLLPDGTQEPVLTVNGRGRAVRYTLLTDENGEILLQKTK